MKTKRSNASARKKIKSVTGLSGLKPLQLPGSVKLKQNKNWIDKWMKQHEKMNKVKTTQVYFSKTPGLVMNWWEN